MNTNFPLDADEVMGKKLAVYGCGDIEIPIGGRPGNFEKYYDAKTG